MGSSAPPSGVVAVPKALRRPHRLVAATREAFLGVKPDETGRLQVRHQPGVAVLQVSHQRLRRTLLILQAIVTEAERRGWEVMRTGSTVSDTDRCQAEPVSDV